uniref:Uncharacterized protein n=1 Tax=Arundo donax TaxID=35708 RepID=A0A0A9A7Q0_ARUDO
MLSNFIAILGLLLLVVVVVDCYQSRFIMLWDVILVA